MTRIAWMIERRIPWGKDWIPFKLPGKPGSYFTRASARREAAKLNEADKARAGAEGWCRLRGWEYRALPYLPRVDSSRRRRTKKVHLTGRRR